jgi:hypothetical protein
VTIFIERLRVTNEQTRDAIRWGLKPPVMLPANSRCSTQINLSATMVRAGETPTAHPQLVNGISNPRSRVAKLTSLPAAAVAKEIRDHRPAASPDGGTSS